jgi:hypothetical protein
MDKTLQVQTQIRQNAEEVSSFLSDMQKWEKQIKSKDTQISKVKPRNRRENLVREGAGTVSLKITSEPAANLLVSATSPEKLTPASIAQPVNTPQISTVPKARGVYVEQDSEEAQRERGNAEFKAGNFTAAVKSYTICLGLKVTVFYMGCSQVLR